MEERKDVVMNVREYDDEETVMCWNETCSDCYYFEGGDSTCRRSGARVNPDHPKCSYFS